MKLASIASGSGGNSIFMGSERYHILIDAGISLRRIEAGLAKLGLSGADIDAVLITHEHSDHVSGLGPLLKKYHMPVYGSPGTLDALGKMAALASFRDEDYRYVTAGNSFKIGDLTVLPIRVSHDASEPLMYRVYCENASAAVLTDTGTVTREMKEKLRDLDALFLEANHDIRMLQVGPYPYYLKKRILSDRGHLCNETAGQLLAELCCPRLKTVVLSHISKTNNYRDLAVESIRLELKVRELQDIPRLLTAPEAELSEIIEV